MLNKLETTAGKKKMLWWVYKSMILCSSVVSQCFSTTRGLKNTRNGRRDYGEAELKHFMYEFQFLDLINCCPGKLIHVYYCVIIISAKPQKSTFDLMGMKKKKWPIPDKIKTNNTIARLVPPKKMINSGDVLQFRTLQRSVVCKYKDK